MTAMPTDAQPVYVSYAWSSESDALVDAFAAKLPPGLQLIRDKQAMRPGDWISRFMQEIGRAELVLVVISEKYLKSVYCMRELFYLHERSLGDRSDLMDRIVPLIVGDVPCARAKDRDVYVRHWEKEHAELDALLKGRGLDTVGEADRRELLAIQDFKQQVSDLLAWISDTLMPQGAALHTEGIDAAVALFSARAAALNSGGNLGNGLLMASAGISSPAARRPAEEAAVSKSLQASEESQTYQPAKADARPAEPIRGWTANELTALIDKIKPVARVKGSAAHAGRAFLVSGWYDEWPEAVADCYGFARDQAGFKKPIPIQPIIDWSCRTTSDQLVKALSNAIYPRAGYPYPIYYALVGYEQRPRADVLAGLLRAWEEVVPGPGETAHSLFIVLTKNGRPLLPVGWWKRQSITGLPAAVREQLGPEYADRVLDPLEAVTAAQVQIWPGLLRRVMGELCPQCIRMNADMISEFASAIPEQGLAHRTLGKRLVAKLTAASPSPSNEIQPHHGHSKTLHR